MVTPWNIAFLVAYFFACFFLFGYMFKRTWEIGYKRGATDAWDHVLALLDEKQRTLKPWDDPVC